MHRWIQSRQRERNPEVIVEIALRREDRVRRGGGRWITSAIGRAEEQRQQILRRGFARAAGNADHRSGESAAVFPRDGLKRHQRIGNDQLWQRERWIRHRDERGARARVLRRGQKIVAVTLAGLERDEDLARPQLSRVDGETRERRDRLGCPTAAGPLRKKSWREGGHAFDVGALCVRL